MRSLLFALILALALASAPAGLPPCDTDTNCDALLDVPAMREE